MSGIQRLKNSIEKKCAGEDYEQVNSCIKELMSNKSKGEAIKMIKALICQIEGIKNKSNAYCVLSIAYALFIGMVSICANYFGSSMPIGAIILLILFITIIIALIACAIMKDDYKYAFILQALNFKLEELNNKEKNDEKPDEENEYIEYILRIKEK